MVSCQIPPIPILAPTPLVKLTIYLTDPRFIEDARAARLKVFGEAVQPTTTLVIIDGLVAQAFSVEVEAWAANASS